MPSSDGRYAVGSVIDVARSEVGEPVPFAPVAITRGDVSLVVWLAAETDGGFRAEVLEVGACG